MAALDQEQQIFTQNCERKLHRTKIKNCPKENHKKIELENKAFFDIKNQGIFQKLIRKPGSNTAECGELTSKA